MVNKKSLLKIIGGIFILGAALVSSLRTKEEVIERPRESPTAKTIYDKGEIELNYEDGRTVQEDLDIKVGVDNKNSKVSLEILTEKFDDESLDKEAIQQKTRVPINGRWSEVYLLHPAEVKITSGMQAGYTIPKHQWIKLIPAEEDKTTQIVKKHGQALINEVVKVSIPFPNADKALESFMKKKSAEKSALLKKLEGLVEEGYNVTLIAGNVQRNISSNLTARYYEIEVDTSQVDSETYLEMYLWAMTTLGDPSETMDGSFQNKSGTDHRIIQFAMTGKKGIPEGEVKVYSKEIEREDGTKNYDLFIKIDGKERRLTNTPIDEESPVLSPNKRLIAFNEKTGTNLHDNYMKCVITIDGTNKMRLYPLNWMQGNNEAKWSEDSKGFVVSRQRSAAIKGGKITCYTDYYYDLNLKTETKIVGGNVIDLDTRQVIPYNETKEKRIERRTKWLENERRQGRKPRGIDNNFLK